MPIDFFTTTEGLHVRQSFDSPTVYLDHWALRTFSEDQAIQNRLVNGLLLKGGTLLLSHLSFAEFSRASDPRHCRDAEIFLERLLPNIYLTDFALDKVHEQELKEHDNTKRFWPSADLPQLKFLAEWGQSAPNGLTVRGLIELSQVFKVQILESVDTGAKEIVVKLESVRQDVNYVSKARRTVPSDQRTRTYIILGELLRGYHLDHTSPISENDAIDLMHAAMSVNCCDYVLLDGPWAERVAKMKQRISKAGHEMPLAKCFSKRAKGIVSFLEDLEAFRGLPRGG